MKHIISSESIIEVSKALLEFHKNVDSIKKTSKNPFFKSSYAPLEEILNAVAIPLQKAGLIITQHPICDDQLETLIIHAESGQYLSSVVPMHSAKNDSQSMGSAITYARRYAIGAILNLSIEPDDDGNKSTQAKQAPEKNWLNPKTKEWISAVEYLKKGGKIDAIKQKYSISKTNADKLMNDSL